MAKDEAEQPKEVDAKDQNAIVEAAREGQDADDFDPQDHGSQDEYEFDGTDDDPDNDENVPDVEPFGNPAVEQGSQPLIDLDTYGS